MDKLTFTQVGTEYTVAAKNKTIDGEVIIPYKYLDHVVTSIKNHGFNRCEYITSVIINAKITVIPDYAFMGCCALKRIVIPSTVKTINYAGICLYNYTSKTIDYKKSCDIIFEENSELEYVGHFGISHGTIRIFFCSPVNALLHHNAYGYGSISVYSPLSFKFNGTLQTHYTDYCYPRVYPDSNKKCTRPRCIKKEPSLFIVLL